MIGKSERRAGRNKRHFDVYRTARKDQRKWRLGDNDVFSAGFYHKMGYIGAPIAHLIMGENNDCRGWLVGEENKGLSYMFQMMNEARISLGCMLLLFPALRIMLL